MCNSKLLDGKVAIITGANRGIGRATLDTFVAQGVSVVYACTRSESEAFTVHCAQITQNSATEIRHLYFDMTDQQAIKDAMRKLYADKLPVDILINNAGVAHGALLQMTPIEQMRQVFEINFFSQMLITQYVSKLMIKQKRGSIVFLSSVAGIDPYAGYSSYGSSKAAVIYAVKTLSKELSGYNIRVNSIAPGLTDTAMAGQMEQKALEAMVGDSAMNRLGRPEEIAQLALFLASDNASFISGQTIRIDGGM